MDWIVTLWMLGGIAIPLFFFASCPCCSACPNCSAIPGSFQIVIADVVNATCTDCSEVNATYTTDDNWKCDTSSDTVCFWNKSIGTSPCTAIGVLDSCIHLQQLLSGSDYITRVEFWTHNAFGAWAKMLTWEHNHGTSAPDCTAFSSLALTYMSDDGRCDGMISSGTVTSL